MTFYNSAYWRQDYAATVQLRHMYHLTSLTSMYPLLLAPANSRNIISLSSRSGHMAKIRVRWHHVSISEYFFLGSRVFETRILRSTGWEAWPPVGASPYLPQPVCPQQYPTFGKSRTNQLSLNFSSNLIWVKMP